MTRAPYVGLHVASGTRRASASDIVDSVTRDYDTHLAALQRALDRRYAACLDALDELMPEGVRWTRPGGGPTLWLELPPSVELPALESRLAKHAIHVSNGSAAFLGRAHLHGFRIAYAYLSEADLRAALTILGAAIRALAR